MRTSYDRNPTGSKPKDTSQDDLTKTRVFADYSDSGDETQLVGTPLTERQVVRASVERAFTDVVQEVKRFRDSESASDVEKALMEDDGKYYDKPAKASEGINDYADYGNPEPHDPISQDVGNDNDGDGKGSKKKSNGSKIGIIVLSCIVVILVVVAVVMVLKIRSGSGIDSGINSVSERIDRLYTGDDKTDIKSDVTQGSLDSFYMELLELQNRGADVTALISELDTIGLYVSDKSRLDTFDSDTYNLTTTGMTDNVEEIVGHTASYSVPGLAVAITNKAQGIMDDYNEFISLRSELMGITDVMSFDVDTYTTRVEAIDHTPNRTELLAVIDTISADKEAAIAQENLRKAEDEEAKAKAESELAEIQELQKKTQEDLENTRQQLQEAADEASEMLKQNQDLQQQLDDAQTENIEDTVETIDSSVQPDTQSNISATVPTDESI